MSDVPIEQLQATIREEKLHAYSLQPKLRKSALIEISRLESVLREKLLKTSIEQTFVAKGEVGFGWRIWNQHANRWWGNFFASYPEDLLKELNGLGRPSVLAQLCKSSLSRECMRRKRRRN